MKVKLFGLALAAALAALVPGVSGSAQAAEGARRVETTPDSDYFGFDLRSEQNKTLEECQTICLGDSACRAFTYNTKAKWCFLKSDFRTLNPFPGAVAGKVVDVVGDPDLGAAPDLSFLPEGLADEARQFRAQLLNGSDDGDGGLAALTEAARQALRSNDPAGAQANFTAALRLSPDDSSLWQGLAQGAMNLTSDDSNAVSDAVGVAANAAVNAYGTSRTAAERADALLVLARVLDRRDQFRPALGAYEASLALINAAAVRAEYEDLKARKGFRIVEHTVDADNASPRVCAQFSEELVKTGVDYASFVTVDERPAKAVEAKDQQLCVEGLEHGAHYRIAFRAGLPAAIGETLASPVSLSVYVRDRAPSIRFTGDSFVLPATARRGIPMVSVNLASADVKLYRIGDRGLAQLLTGYQFLTQLGSYDASSIDETQGEKVWEGHLDIVDNQLNKDTVTSFPLDEALPVRKPGVYVMVATPPDLRADDYSNRATQWLVVSDIGLSTYTAEDGLSVFTRSLGTAKPMSGVELTLLARNNEILGTARTDAQGRAVFQPGLARGTGAMAPAVLTAKTDANDFVFLDMTRAGFDLSDRGVAGRTVAGALDVYAWTERGIYRAGETVHAAALARNAAAEAVDDLPLTFVFARPDGAEERRIVSDGKALGGHAVDLALEPNAQRGTWTLSLYTDPEQPAVASVAFLVDDFVPDRIEFDLSADATEVTPRQPVNLSVDGRFLYGAPAAGLELEGDVTLSTKTDWDRFPGYQFGLADEEQGDATRIDLSDLPVVDDDGKASFPLTLGELPSTTRLINAHVAVRMRETGGRAVERTLDLPVQPESDMIGIRPGFAGGEIPEGALANFDVIAVGPDGARKALGGLDWRLVKVERSYQWYRQNDSWNYEPITTTSIVSSGTTATTADAAAKISVPTDWGHYRLEVETSDPDGPTSSVEFDSGWYVAQTSTETPDGLEIALDKATYKPGDVAKLKVSPHFGGELLVTVGADRLLAVQSATIAADGGTVDIPVGEDWGSGVYVTATLFRPGDAEASRMPARAIGVKWMGVEASGRTLDVALSRPAKTEPRQPLTIPVAVSGAEPGEEAYAIVAAVDVGILNLTRYEPPNPEKWFYGQRRLGIELRDLYGRLIDGSLGTTGRLRTGGDGGAMQAQGNPPKEKLVAFFSGPVKLDRDGRATLAFELPQFNGTVRVMAVAWTKRALGHAVSDVTVRDPVVVTASLPRFLAPGDRAEMRLDLTNVDLPAGDYSLAVETSEALAADDAALPEKIRLDPNKRQSLKVPLTGMTNAADASVTVRLAGTDGSELEQVLALPVRPAALPVTTRNAVTLAANGGSLRVDKELLAASQLDGATVSLGVSLSSALDVPSLLLALDRYPYGCAEQTTSRALPLLYVNEMAATAGMADDPELKARIQDAIYRDLSYQSSSGSFGLWGPGYGDLWLDAYVTDFLSRAREEGYDVPAQSLKIALDNLQNGVSYDVDLDARGSAVAYAFYVLARNKKASVGDLRYYSDTQIEAFKSPMAIAQLAAALDLYGDHARAETTFEAAVALAKAGAKGGLERDDYGSALRDDAAMLALAAESKPTPRVVPELIAMVSAERAGRGLTSTQEDAWMLLAARALKNGNDSLALEVNGARHVGALRQDLMGEVLEREPITIVNRSASAVEAVVTAVAAPAEPLPASGDGFTIERTYYTLDGEPANVSQAKQNERFVVVLKIEEFNAWTSRVLVQDLLPAGFEIDNPGLVSSAELGNFDWLPQTEAAHLEFRDDRFVAAFNRGSGDDRSITLAYVVRAVTPGTYTHPQASVEDMYRPQFAARTATGMMEVSAE